MIVLLAAAILAAAPVKKKVIVAKKSSAVRRPAVRKAGSTMAGSARTGSRKTVSRKPGSKSRAPVARKPAVQLSPSSERYKEIQEALIAKGYLKTPSSGVWDSDSQEAMRRFQADQNLDSNGKLTSLTLISLGLGSKQQ